MLKKKSRLYVASLGNTWKVRNIAEGLERDKIKTGGKKYKWHLSTVQGILRNEKYIGDALLQKTITTDFIEKTRIKNDGSVPQYYVKDSQEAIIPRDIFTQVQEEMVRRANLFSGEDGKKKRVYSSKYALSSICTARSVVTFTAESHGTTEASTPSYGAVVPE